MGRAGRKTGGGPSGYKWAAACEPLRPGLDGGPQQLVARRLVPAA